MGTLLLLAYVVIGYWAVGQTFLGKPLFGNYRTLQAQKLFCAIFLGVFIIPIVLIKKAMEGRN